MLLKLAMPNKVYQKFGQEPLVRKIFSRYQVKLLLYSTDSTQKISWLK